MERDKWVWFPPLGDIPDHDVVNNSGKAEAILQDITRVPYFVFVFRSPLSYELAFR